MAQTKSQTGKIVIKPGWHRPSLVLAACLLVIVIEIALGRTALAAESLVDRFSPISAQAQARLREALRQHEIMANDIPAPVIPSGALLEPGESDARILQVRKRLRQGPDDLVTSKPGETHVYDNALQERVRSFQARFGLLPDGRIGPATIEAMNVPLSARIRLLRSNLERLKRLRRAIRSQRYILVNLPAQQLAAVRNHQIELSSAVIIGRTDRPTPVIDASIRAVNIHPAWYVPASIVRRDLFPRFRNDPGYFERRRFLIYAGDGRTPIKPADVIQRGLTANQIRLVQQPGPENSLGRIRIDMPNRYAVYLHDTPVPRLFGWTDRLFSSGCVRVARVVELAAWLISERGNPDLTPISEALRSEYPQTFKLPEKIPVHFIYQTAWVDNQGQTNFRRDVYGLYGTAGKYYSSARRE